MVGRLRRHIFDREGAGCSAPLTCAGGSYPPCIGQRGPAGWNGNSGREPVRRLMSSCRLPHRATSSAIYAGGAEKAARHCSRASNAGPFVRQRHRDRSYRQRGEGYYRPSWIALIYVIPSKPEGDVPGSRQLAVRGWRRTIQQWWRGIRRGGINRQLQAAGALRDEYGAHGRRRSSP